ncbi:hypothetical protein M409DRAFT_58778 [Zasmidium cellare ATCC 36951]|uniref:ZIP zinc/iron transport family n=1 Tax=Zasmidium cellare ATCC 36951 TaxID=1080233 RepID=A0A6A6C3U2_ZASCE|nr:uncharacterized protein M409DRAFT_58778 [Zasmidium cellare ATCC 36951]KAF2161691.1 hypothetical protein M409DRAFT_58778 [Zasmidium cellare ATCC 36951]
MSSCSEGNKFDGRIGLRISSIFVILVGSALGAIVPVYAARSRGTSKDLKVPEQVFFVARYFGSGVILATALIHLLVPAFEALTDDCLTGPITEYPWAAGIVLMSWFVIFIVHVLTSRYEKSDQDHAKPEPSETAAIRTPADCKYRDDPSSAELSDESQRQSTPLQETFASEEPRVEDRCISEDRADSNHSRENAFNPDSYAAQLTGLFILEFGVIFHSVFIGLTLSVAGGEFATLYVVLTLHQTFEGIALGARLGSIDWPTSKRWTPYLMAIGYALSTPIAIAIGLGVRTTFNPESQTTLIVNGVFDSISAGILIYTSLVELVAHDFLFSPKMRAAPLKVVYASIGFMMLGAGLMALLGKWA